MDTDTRGMYVNLDLVDEVGIDRALLDPGNGPLTYDQMWEIDEQVSVQDGRGTYELVTWIPWDDQASLLTWAMTTEFSLFDNQPFGMLLIAPEILAVAEVYAGWV